MELTYKVINNKVEILLDGELDHHNAKKAIERMGQILCLHPESDFVLDFKKITFMDSSGIAVVMNGWKNVGRNGKTLQVQNVPEHAMRVFEAAGIDQIVTILKEGK